jgi:hypothetical protein
MCDVVRLVRDPRDACCRGDGRPSVPASAKLAVRARRVVQKLERWPQRVEHMYQARWPSEVANLHSGDPPPRKLPGCFHVKGRIHRQNTAGPSSSSHRQRGWGIRHHSSPISGQTFGVVSVEQTH